MNNHPRQYSKLDQFCMSMDEALRGASGKASPMRRAYPAATVPEAALSTHERKQSAALMRVNHAGEVCAQALYHGQSLVSRDPIIQQQLQLAAIEEGDHLAWCRLRLAELDSHTSYLNPLWYMGSFVIGLAAGLVSDSCSLGFVAETETQVVKHLESHLENLPANDHKSAAILQQMQKDEAEHRDTAMQAGALELPLMVKKAMRLISKVMVKTAYWV
jgi:ubiquinone biosynthesis monooxygenase Coq7